MHDEDFRSGSARALRVAAHFGITAVAAAELPGGWVNDNWLVESRDGARFVMRRYGRMHVTRRAVSFEHAVMRHAAARISEVCVPLADAGGETLFLEDGALAAVFPYVAGQTGVRAAAAPAAATLSRFHVALADFRPARTRRSRTAGALASLRERFVHFAAEPVLARKLPWNELDVAIARSQSRVVRHNGRLPLATVHGDPHPDNFVVDAGRVAGLIDFDFSHETERAFDVGSAMDAFARATEEAGLDVALAAGVARAYHAAVPLGDDEWQLLPDFMLRRSAFLMWYVVSRHGRRAFGDIGNAERYARRVLELDKIAAAWETTEWRAH